MTAGLGYSSPVYGRQSLVLGDSSGPALETRCFSGVDSPDNPCRGRVDGTSPCAKASIMVSRSLAAVTMMSSLSSRSLILTRSDIEESWSPLPRGEHSAEASPASGVEADSGTANLTGFFESLAVVTAV